MSFANDEVALLCAGLICTLNGAACLKAMPEFLLSATILATGRSAVFWANMLIEQHVQIIARDKVVNIFFIT